MTEEEVDSEAYINIIFRFVGLKRDKIMFPRFNTNFFMKVAIEPPKVDKTKRKTFQPSIKVSIKHGNSFRTLYGSDVTQNIKSIDYFNQTLNFAQESGAICVYL